MIRYFLIAMALMASGSRFVSAQPEVSQIVVTNYTGSDASPSQPEFIYRLTLKSNGEAIYVGNATYMKRIGRYQGIVDKRDFLRLADLFKKYKSKGNTYSYIEYDGPEDKSRRNASVTYEIISGNRRRTIHIYEPSQSKSTQRASQIHYGLLWKIAWTKVSSSDALSN